VKWGKPWYNPVRLLSVIPGIKLILLSKIPLATLIFMSLYLTSMRRCNGIIILRAYFLPNSIYAKTELREIIGVRGVYGTQMPTEESMLQVCSIWLLKMCIGSIVPELKHLQSVSYRFCLERKLFKHTRYAAILSKRIFGFYF
jgi:hypothetical protein